MLHCMLQYLKADKSLYKLKWSFQIVYKIFVSVAFSQTKEVLNVFMSLAKQNNIWGHSSILCELEMFFSISISSIIQERQTENLSKP